MRKQMKETAGIEEYACGGKMHKYGLGGNMFDEGGALEWLSKNTRLGERDRKAVAKALNKYMEANKNNYYRPQSTGLIWLFSFF